MATEIQTLEPAQRLSITTQPQPFLSAYENLAKSDTFMGDLGATIAQQASIQYNRNMGLQYGMNPQGDLLPPITTADKAFQEGYIAQSKNTLSLQANQMLNQAEEQLNQSYKLSDQQINDYQAQMSKGLAGIMKVAPTEVQATLGYQYQTQLQNNTSQLRNKLINQSKSEALDNMKVNDKLTDKNINNLATTGNADAAKELYQQKLAQNQKQFNSGMMTKSEMEASNSSAKITYYQGLYNNKLIELEQKSRTQVKGSRDKLRGEFLKQFTNFQAKPKDISADEWTTLGNNTLAFQQHLNNMESVAVNYAFSDLNLKAAQGTITNLDIQSVANMPGVSDTRMNEWLARFKQAKATQSQENSLTSAILSDYSNSKLWAETTSDKAKDNAYFQVVQMNTQNKPNAAPLQNEAQAASVAGGPVPAFNRVLSGFSRSSNPQEVRAAYNAYETVMLNNPKNLYGLDNQVVQSLQAFGAITRNNPGMSDDVAVQNVLNARNRTMEQKKLLQEQWDNEVVGANGVLSSYKDKVKKAEEILGQTGFFIKKTPLLNKSSITANLMNILKSNYDFVGNYSEALEMTKQAANIIYGSSKVNGEAAISMYPLEKMANLENGHFFFQKDIVEQMQQKFKKQEQAAKQGITSTYYRIKDPEMYNLDNMTQDKYNKITRRADPIMVETVSIVDGKESVIDESSLVVDISQETQLSYDPANPVSGDYDVSLAHKTGYPRMLNYYGSYDPQHMTYTPNFQKVKNEYDKMFSKFGKKPMSNTEEIMSLFSKSEPSNQFSLSDVVEGAGE